MIQHDKIQPSLWRDDEGLAFLEVPRGLAVVLGGSATLTSAGGAYSPP
jgi:hypothetical protein